MTKLLRCFWFGLSHYNSKPLSKSCILVILTHPTKISHGLTQKKFCDTPDFILLKNSCYNCKDCGKGKFYE